MNDLIRDKIKEIINMQDIIETDNLRYKLKSRKDFDFSKYSLSIVFKRYT